MSRIRIFNDMSTPVSDFLHLDSERFITDLIDTPPLIDDVDTTILSFLDAYGRPPHIDIEDGDDSDLDDFSDDDVDAEFDIVKPAPAKLEPLKTPVEPINPADSVVTTQPVGEVKVSE